MITGPDNQPWMAERKCRDQDPELWYPQTLRGADRRAAEHVAISICGGCPVIDACLTFALDTNDVWAILGGTTPEQRRQMKRVAS